MNTTNTRGMRKMSKSLLSELEAVAKKHGKTLFHQCAYCQAETDSPCEGETHHMLTIVDKHGPRTKRKS